eukprot:TRINITY_DN6718_c0_g1_i1.p1 TRINITY_DN6718_c0_g1~~TRINITY_DN6718_c0_g1_i1.p1  ORF type:complete len:147 (+),score=32.01 TRINITY_DN6718_c0_g1_i1:753-1193(+)
MASRIDSFSDIRTNKYGEKMKDQVEERLEFYETGKAPQKNLDAMHEAAEQAKSDAVVMDGDDDDMDMDEAPVTPKKSKKKKDKKKKKKKDKDVEMADNSSKEKKSKKKKRKSSSTQVELQYLQFVIEPICFKIIQVTVQKKVKKKK